VLRLLQWLVRREHLLRLLSPVFGRFQPFSAAHRRNPHDTWRSLREHAPAYRSRVFGTTLFTRYEDVLRILSDPRFSTDRSQVPAMRWVARLTRGEPEFAGLIERNLLTIDGADHRRLRGLVAKAFTPRRVERLRPRLVGIAEDLLDRASAGGRASGIELVRDFAHPFPVVAIAELLGVPAEDRDRFRRWGQALVQLLDPLQGRGGVRPLIEATAEIFAYFRPLLAERRAQPRDDLLTAMIQAEEGGDRLEELDLLALSALLLVAGHETTSNLIGNAVLLLLRFPQERKRLQDDPGLLPTAVEECLRFESPIQLTDRAVVEDCELRGVRLRRNQMAAAVLAAANRDPRAFAEAERFDVGRRDNRHLAFGHGSHFCLGASLARAEAEIALATLLRRFPDFRGDPEPPAWRRSMIVRGPEAVPLRLAP